MKRILIFSLQYYPFVGGAEIAIKEITDRLDPKEVEFDMITLQYDSNQRRIERIGNVIVHRIGPGKKGLTISQSFSKLFYVHKALFVPLAAVKGYSLWRTRHYTGAWAMMTYMVFPLVLMRFAGARIPYMLTLQEGDPFEHVFERPHIRFVSKLLRYGIQKATVVQAISTFLADWARASGYGGRIEVVPNGVDLTRFARQSASEEIARERARLGKKEGETWLVTTSRLVHKNAVDDVIRAVALLPSNIHFAVFGEGPLDDELKKLADELKVAGQVHFFGAVPNADLPLALKACDIFVRPSRSEGMGISFVEAMAAGLPVVATQEGGIKDFLFDARRNPDVPATGWAVDPDSPDQIAEAVKTILADPEHASRVTRAAATLVTDNYGWKGIALRMRSFFLKILV